MDELFMVWAALSFYWALRYAAGLRKIHICPESGIPISPSLLALKKGKGISIADCILFPSLMIIATCVYFTFNFGFFVALYVSCVSCGFLGVGRLLRKLRRPKVQSDGKILKDTNQGIKKSLEENSKKSIAALYKESLKKHISTESSVESSLLRRDKLNMSSKSNYSGSEDHCQSEDNISALDVSPSQHAALLRLGVIGIGVYSSGFLFLWLPTEVFLRGSCDVEPDIDGSIPVNPLRILQLVHSIFHWFSSLAPFTLTQLILALWLVTGGEPEESESEDAVLEHHRRIKFWSLKKEFFLEKSEKNGFSCKHCI